MRGNFSMLNSSLTLRTRSSAGALVKSLCLALGLAFTFAPSSLTAQDKKPAADEKAPVEEKDAAPVTPRSEKEALKEFKSDMAAIKKWTIAEQAKAKENPMAGLKMVGAMNAKIGKVRTDGLPEDLAGEYKKMTGVIKQMAALFKGMPEDDAELMSWAQSKFTDPAFGEKMQTLGKEATETGEKLKTIGKKYGVDEELDFDGKDKKGKDDGEEEDGDKKEKGKTEKPEEK